MFPLQVDGVGLVVQLDGTGGDPPPSTERDMLLNEMKKNRADEPNTVLASRETALVVVRGIIPAGAQAGDRIDLEVAAPADSGTQSLRSGWLMPARLREYAVINRRVTAGRELCDRSGQRHDRGAVS